MAHLALEEAGDTRSAGCTVRNPVRKPYNDTTAGKNAGCFILGAGKSFKLSRNHAQDCTGKDGHRGDPRTLSGGAGQR